MLGPSSPQRLLPPTAKIQDVGEECDERTRCEQLQIEQDSH